MSHTATPAALHTVTVALVGTPASITGAQSVTVTYASERKAVDARDGNARRAILRAVCSTLSKSDKGRAILSDASKGGAACAILALATPAMWKDSAATLELYKHSPTGKDAEGDSGARPNPVAEASRTLDAWEAAQAKAEAAKAKPTPAPVEAAPVHTCALPPVEAKPEGKAKAPTRKAKASE